MFSFLGLFGLLYIVIYMAYALMISLWWYSLKLILMVFCSIDAGLIYAGLLFFNDGLHDGLMFFMLSLEVSFDGYSWWLVWRINK